MNVNDILTFNTQVLFIALSIIALVGYARRGGMQRRDFFLFAFALGFPLGITFVRRFTPLKSSFLDLAGAFALFSQPYFLFRLFQYFRPGQRRIGLLILAGFLLCCILLLNRMAAAPAMTITIIFSYCSAAEAYVTWGYYRGTRDTSGTLHRRMTIITVSSAIFTLAFIIDALKAQFPNLGITPLAQAGAAVSAILFYFAFSPPRWLRRAWQMEELRGYLSQVKVAPTDSDFVIKNLQQLSQWAMQITNGLATGVIKADELTQTPLVLVSTNQSLFSRLCMFAPPFIREVQDSHKPAYRLVAHIAEPNQRRQLETLGAQTWLLMPIQSQKHVWGLLVVALRYRSLFIDDDLDILDRLTQECALILENHRLIDDLQSSLDELEQKVEERQRIASELHDAVTQTLFSASISAEILPKLWQRDPERGLKQTNFIVSLNRAMMAQLRTLIQELRPELLLQASLSMLLQQLVDASQGRMNIEAQIMVEGSENSLPSEVQITFFRISQECISNIVKYSGATAYTIHLRIEPENVQLQIHDNGKGFDSLTAGDGDGFGLDIIQERAESIGATFSIQSQPQDGTTISILWKNGHRVAA